MNEKSPKTQIAAKAKDATNILVTVSRDPSVDELAAALALTFMLDKLGKHATAVFSGAIPPAINFLEPEKTFEDSTSSLRDFIISLDKDKADRLRYKVDGDVVKVFITPYKTKISEKDLEFSEGEFNVELVVAIGVEKKDDLDGAIAAHGRILHNATVATINLDGKGSLGTISWADATASSYSELVAGLGDSLQDGLLDEQIATALLTGLVSATDQFRNDKTSPKVMTLAAQLMAAGANQQLIASELEQNTADGISLSDKKAVKQGDGQGERKSTTDELEINHDKPEAPVAPETAQAAPVAENVLQQPKRPSTSEEALAEAEAKLSAAMQAPSPAITSLDTHSPEEKIDTEPTFGAALDATTAQAEADKRSAQADTQNRTILSHGTPYTAGSDPNQLAQGNDGEPPAVNPFASPPSAPMIQSPMPAKSPSVSPLGDLQAAATAIAQPTENLASDVAAASLPPLAPAPDLAEQPAATAPTPVAPPTASAPEAASLPPPPTAADLGLPPYLPPPPPLPPVPDFSELGMPDAPPTAAPPVEPADQVPQPDLTIPEPVPVPTQSPAPAPVTPAPPTALPTDNPMFPSVATGASNPGQFQIPSQ